MDDKVVMNTIKWYSKQLLPLKYKSHYYAHNIDPVNGQDITKTVPVTCEWRMWFGFSFNEVYRSGHV